MKKLFTMILVVGMVLGMFMGLESATKKKRMKYIAENFYLSQEVKDCIMKRDICIGMTMQDVIVSKWAPDRVLKSAYENLTTEMWVLEEVGKTWYLHFEDRILKSWTVSR